MKHLFIILLALFCLSCIKIDRGNNQGQQQTSQEQEFKEPEDTNPDGSGVEIKDEDNNEDDIANTDFDGTIEISYTDSEAKVSGSVKNVTVSTEGAKVTATNTGGKKVKYVLSGTSSNGSFKIYSEKKQAIVLKDLSLTNPNGAAINNQSKKRTFVVLEGTNNLADGNVNASGDYPEETSEEDMKAAFFSEAQLIFSGTGSLTVNAKGKAGITSDDYVRFMDGPTIDVNTSNGHGVRGKDAIMVSGGTINVTLSSTATAKKCFSTDSLMLFESGNTVLVNNAPAGNVDGELTGASCIKADRKFVMRGGTLTATASGKGGKCISGDEEGFFEGGTVIAKATGSNYGTNSTGGKWQDDNNSVTAKAIKFDGDLEISGGTLNITSSSHEAIESKAVIYISGGEIIAVSSDDAINSGSTLTISGGAVYACSTGNDGLDANGNLIIKGGFVLAVGSRSPEVGIDANTEQGYRFYLQGGNVIAIGGIEQNSSVSQAVVSTSWSTNKIYSLCDGENVIYSFKTPSSGGSGMILSSAKLVNGSKYTLKSGATVTGAESYCDGILSLGGTATGGSSSSVTASTYSGGGNNPGGGGPGGGGRW